MLASTTTSFEPVVEAQRLLSAVGQTPPASQLPSSARAMRQRLRRRDPGETTAGTGSNETEVLAATHITENISRHAMVPWLSNRSERRRRAALGIPILEHAIMLNRWQGQVQEVLQDSFKAVLFDLNRPELTEFAEFSFNEISDEDIASLRPGSVFYWYVLLHTNAQGKRKRETWIWFRRGGRMTQEEYQLSRQRIEDEWRAFEGDNSTQEATSSG
jgi:hypothetical protein